MYQQMSGLAVTGQLDDDTVQQTMITRCGAADVVQDHPDHDHAQWTGAHELLQGRPRYGSRKRFLAPARAATQFLVELPAIRTL